MISNRESRLHNRRLKWWSFLQGKNLSHSGINTNGSRSGKSPRSQLIPFHHPKWEIPTLVSAALIVSRTLLGITTTMEDGTGSLVSMPFWRNSNYRTYRKWALCLFSDAWSKCRSCFTSTSSVRLVGKKWFCSLIICMMTTMLQ